MPKDSVKVEVKEGPKPLPVLVSSTAPNPPEMTGAATVIQAAIQTGERANQAETAAQNAEKTLQDSRALIAELKASLQPDLEAIGTRLSALEEELAENPEETEEEIALQDTSNTHVIAAVKTVETKEQVAASPNPSNTQQPEKPGNKKERGGLFKRLFLNR